MFDLGLLGAGSLLVLAASNPVCKAEKPTEINIKPVSQKVGLNTSTSLANMQGLETSTVNPHSFGGISVMQGYAESKIQIKWSIKLDAAPAKGTRDGICIWYENITVEFDVDPTIHLAKEVNADLCMRKAVYEHEMKHVKTDRRVINKYSAIIGQVLSTELRKRGFVAGPLKIEHAADIAKRMQETVTQLIRHQNKKFDIERAEAQAQVDTLEEYERVAAKCPHFKVTKEMVEGGSDTRRSSYGR